MEQKTQREIYDARTNCRVKARITEEKTRHDLLKFGGANAIISRIYFRFSIYLESD